MKIFSVISIQRVIHPRLVILMLALAFHIDLNAQTKKNNKKTRVRMSLDYYNGADKSRYLIASLYFIENRVRNPVVNGSVTFYLGDISENNI